MLVESWKCRFQQQCLAEPDAKSTETPVTFWIIVRQNMHASLKPANLRENVCKELFKKVMKIRLQGRGIISLSLLNSIVYSSHARHVST